MVPAPKKKSSCLGTAIKTALIIIGLLIVLGVIVALLPKKNTPATPASKSSIILVPTFTSAPTDTPASSPTAPTDTPAPSPTAPPTDAPAPAPVLLATDTPLPPVDTATPVAAAPLATETAVPAAAAPQMSYVCDHDAYNCSDFNTHAAAQAAFDYCSVNGFGDIHGLDGADGDGVVCESLP